MNDIKKIMQNIGGSLPKADLSKTNEQLEKIIEKTKLLPKEVVNNSNIKQLLSDVVHLKK